MVISVTLIIIALVAYKLQIVHDDGDDGTMNH